MRLYNSFDNKKHELKLKDNKLSIYVCGPTVQAPPHLGHMRGAVNYDILHRYALFRGICVTFIRNITDIDDKILALHTEKTPWWAVAYKNEIAFNNAYDALNILPCSYSPRATQCIADIINIIEKLIDNGFAYCLDGSVYFDISRDKDYGVLTHQNPKDMLSEDEVNNKKNPQDFALWKAYKPNEPSDASWNSPWGRGRPGWHIECTAMASKYLGSGFNIHGGGLDLRFPHHENELAQARGLDFPFADIWMHSGLINIGSEKMSKSLGNSILIDDLLKKYSAQTIRFAIISSHYRSAIDYSPKIFDLAYKNLNTINAFLDGIDGSFKESLTTLLPKAFQEALDDDLNTPKAISVIFDEIKKKDAESKQKVAAMSYILGIYKPDFAQKKEIELSSAGEDLDQNAKTVLLNIAAYIKYGNDIYAKEALCAKLEFFNQWLKMPKPDFSNIASEKLIDFAYISVDAILTLRQQYKENKDYALADALRNMLIFAGVQDIKDETGGKFSYKI